MSDWARVLYNGFFMRDVLAKIIPGFIAIMVFLNAFEINPQDMLPIGIEPGTYVGEYRDLTPTSKKLVTFIVERSKLRPVKHTQFIIWFLLIPLSFWAGMALQNVGRTIGLMNITPPKKWPEWWGSSSNPIAFLYRRWPKRWRDAWALPEVEKGEPAEKILSDHSQRQAKIRVLESIKPRIGDQRERYVVIKEGTGNLGLALDLLLAFQFLFVVLNYLGYAHRTLFGWPEIVVLVVIAVILRLSNMYHAIEQKRFEFNVIRQNTTLR